MQHFQLSLKLVIISRVFFGTQCSSLCVTVKDFVVATTKTFVNRSHSTYIERY